MSRARVILGKWGEEQAAKFLQQKGFIILERNARTPYGEIDLIARLDVPSESQLIFVEVKTRTSRRFGYPEEALTRAKRQHLLDSISYYIQEHADWQGDWRVDVLSVECKRIGGPVKILHFENAITE